MKKFTFSLLVALMSMSLFAHVSTPNVRMNRSEKPVFDGQKVVVDRSLGHKFAGAVTTRRNAPAKVAAFAEPEYVDAAWWGSYTGVNGDFSIYFYDATGNFITFASINAADSAHIAGTYNNVTFEQVAFAAGDTVDLVGTLTIVGVRWEDGEPVYNVSVNAADANSRTWQFSKEFSVFAYDYYMAYLYYYYMELEWSEAASYASIDLEDIEFALTGDTIDITIDDPVEFAQGSGWIQVEGENDEVYVSICLNIDAPVAGHYTNADFDLSYTGIIYDDGTTVLPKEGVCDITIVADTTFYHAYLTGKDGNVYDIHLKYFLPAATRTATFTGAVELDDYTTDWYATGFNADSTVYVSLDFYYSDAIAGTYGNDDIYAKYSYVVEIDGTDTTYLDIISADLTVAVDADNNVTITGTFTAQNEDDDTDVVEYTVNITSSLPTGLLYDSKDTPFNESFTEYEIDSRYALKYGVLYVSAQNSNNAYVSLMVYTGSTSSSLADGTYNINDTEGAKTVYAGAGIDSDGYIVGSFASFLNPATGNIVDPLWYLVSGTMTVTNGAISITAKNSYDQDIHISMDKPAALDDVEGSSNIMKTLRNGQIIIRVNDKEYNVLGTQL